MVMPRAIVLTSERPLSRHIGCCRVDANDIDVRSEINQGSTKVPGAAADVEHALTAADAGERGEARCQTRAPSTHEALISCWIGVGHACARGVPVTDEAKDGASRLNYSPSVSLPTRSGTRGELRPLARPAADARCEYRAAAPSSRAERFFSPPRRKPSQR